MYGILLNNFKIVYFCYLLKLVIFHYLFIIILKFEYLRLILHLFVSTNLLTIAFHAITQSTKIHIRLHTTW